jgi:hypothetical protein
VFKRCNANVDCFPAIKGDGCVYICERDLGAT